MSELQTKMIENTSGQPPTLWQYATHTEHGVEWVDLEENLIGLVESGRKRIRYAQSEYTVESGELFLLVPGKHYVENLPASDGSYKETCLRFDNRQMADALSTLVSLYGMEIRHPRSARPDPTLAHVHVKVWPEMQLFFDSLTPYLDTDYLGLHTEMLRLKLAEFAYMVITHKEYGLQHKLLQCIDRLSDPFESIIRNSIFENLTIEELALRTNKSLTSFKNDFQRVFGETPHRWIIKQRLLHARLLVVSTNKAISQIGYECRFDNISHFIKLFKREFGLTPLSLRQEQRQ